VHVGLVVGERKRYPSDLSDEQWALVGPFLQAWKAKHPSVSGHRGRFELREIVNAIFYQNRAGCQWAYLPHDLPPKSATYNYFGVRHEAPARREAWVTEGGERPPRRAVVAAW
jgi:transposase